MHQEKAALRLINFLAGSIILHVFFLSFSQQTFWKPTGNSQHFSQADLHEPLTARLVPGELPSVASPQPTHDRVDHTPSLITQQAAKAPRVPSSSTTKPMASTYHAAHELTRMPEMIGQPPNIIEMGQDLAGEVVLKLSISRLGKVTLLQRLKSSLPRETEGKLALQLYRAEYRPGEIDGVAVDSEMTVDFNLDSRGWLSDKLPVLRQGKSPESP